ncbi:MULTISPECIES: CDP-alcohol phosphatidyltransferase family protein [unclassified Roseitalea]|uniref:CDP-alcohol phosphatidyltransferase family protein n=1 Tax=unclassified Roseitalea TaxID=2639107 RepID=UPI00273E9EF8|nr:MULTISPECIES: CDP-alcohol phosphatidyltransferase family protein [unclassified Roseitalea]
MLDAALRPKIDPAMNRLAAHLARAGITANQVTIAGLVIGLCAAAAIALHWFWLGLVLVLASRLCDGLDGPLARLRGKTDYGGYLDIVLDFAFYGAIPVGFVFADPAANAVPGAVLVLSFYVNGASFLAYAIMAERHGLTSERHGDKSIFFTTGLAEATETIAVFVLMCLFPAWFPAIAWVFAAICLYTALSRIVLASRTLR